MKKIIALGKLKGKKQAAKPTPGARAETVGMKLVCAFVAGNAVKFAVCGLN